jgi:hypothetical protein
LAFKNIITDPTLRVTGFWISCSSVTTAANWGGGGGMALRYAIHAFPLTCRRRVISTASARVTCQAA